MSLLNNNSTINTNATTSEIAQTSGTKYLIIETKNIIHSFVNSLKKNENNKYQQQKKTKGEIPSSKQKKRQISEISTDKPKSLTNDTVEPVVTLSVLEEHQQQQEEKLNYNTSMTEFLPLEVLSLDEQEELVTSV